MKCYNCRKQVPDGADFCKHCEADLRTQDDVPHEEVARVLAQMDPAVLAEMQHLAESCETAEEFVNAIFVGACPKCESENVGSFEEVVDVEDPTVARCFDCGHCWCTECDRPVEDPKVSCGHWAVCEECGKDDECPYLMEATSCPKIRKWLKKQK
ncbi:MAG: hypothetical protein A3K19_19805 [Lentisphaerae bacterium RIFOXYB12_FULL_65_16]|nr:MAG: hypothetical protein A3K18_07545 [Lentisphaerae bacterium RIFOXYA12_64_32]OGV85053.1 MAG: hypothetical protein A3K19_19805 [Lentisphaerae bacterium RIFOXYB12_FULL_65_16]